MFPAILFVLMFTLGMTPDAALAVSPHTGGAGQDTCAACHALHEASTEGSLMRGAGPAAEGEVSTCLFCHDGTGASGNVKSGPDSFAGLSGHRLEDVTDLLEARDLSNSCSDCHQPHGDPALRPKLPGATVNGVAVAATGNDWCFACHNDAQDWYAAFGAYPSLSDPSRDATGYPTLGTYPGQSVYSDPASNAHASIPTEAAPGARVQGDCLYCHSAHGSPNGYDGLNATFRPSTPATALGDRIGGTYAAACLQCHDGTRSADDAENIKQFITHEAAEEGLMASGGHRIKSAGGTLPVNSPLPCYDCHNPHGSSRGNASLISDELGGDLGTADATSVRRFCLSCHVTFEVTGWDSDAATYVSLSSSAEEVEGLLRNGGVFASGPDGGYNWLRLKQTPGHYEADAQSCYECHGNDYSAADKNNVHDPGSYSVALHTATVANASITIRGVAYADQVCAACHAMELSPEHLKPSSSSSADACGACHPGARASVPDWGNDTCAEGDCHAGASSAIMHAEVDGEHASPAVSCTAAGCHDENGLAAVHDDGDPGTDDCANCHAAGVPTTGDCATCHGFGEHPPHTVSGPCVASGCHDTDAPTNDDIADAIVIHDSVGDPGPGCDACHADGTTPSFACGSCHAAPHPEANHGTAASACGGEYGACHNAGNIMSVHGDDCGSCHPTPAEGMTYSGQCDQCHVVHAEVGGHPDSDYHGDDNCWDCHEGDEGGCTIPACHPHIYERTPPQTTSNAQPSYAGPATIVLTATDLGEFGGWPPARWYISGIKTTYFQVNGGPLQEGTLALVLPPAEGTVTKTVEFWSIDNNYNIEAHNIASFTISAGGSVDGTPPTGSMAINGGASYTNTAVASVSSAVSDLESGVAAMRIDAGAGYGGWLPYATSVPVTLASGIGTKTVTVQYMNNAGGILTVSDTIVVEITPPTGWVSVNGGANHTNVSSVTLTLSASDVGGSGVAQMQFSNNNTTWSAFEPYATSKAWTLASGTGSRTVYVRYRDNAGNTSNTYSDNITVETAAPTGSITINSGAAYTNSATVTLTLSAADTGGSGVGQMQFSNDNTTWSSWQAYTTSRSWTLTAGAGSKTVYARYRDNAGNVSGVSQDGITVDLGTPTGTVLINGGDAETSIGTVTLTLSASDTGGSGVSQMQFSNDNTNWSALEAYATTKSWTLSSGAGLKTVYVRYRDAAGNLGSASDTITLTAAVDTIAPTTTSNALAYHVEEAYITLTAADDVGGSGIASTYYRVDGGAPQTGTAIVVGTLGAHSIEYWSVDLAGNEELPHTTKSVQVLAGSSTATFAYTGTDQSYVVPAGVIALKVEIWGAAGGDWGDGVGGEGGHVTMSIPVEPRQALTVRVGGTTTTGAGGWPNGGDGDGSCGAGGGGSSSMRSGTTVLAEAGGGGGADHDPIDGEPGGTPGWLPGGDQDGGNGSAGGGGGWNGGAANPYGNEHSGSGDGGTSYVSQGAGLLTVGGWTGNGRVEITPCVQQTGTITFQWDAPDYGDPWADFYIYDYFGGLVHFASSGSGIDWDPRYVVPVPVDPLPYYWYTEWYDPDYDEGTTGGNALIDYPGKNESYGY